MLNYIITTAHLTVEYVKLFIQRNVRSVSNYVCNIHNLAYIYIYIYIYISLHTTE